MSRIFNPPRNNNQALQNAINELVADIANLDTDARILDPDKRIAAIAPADLPNPLPAANKGEYFYFNAAGTINLSSLSYQINPGDRLWCNADGTTAGLEINWEVIALSPQRGASEKIVLNSPTNFYLDQYLGVDNDSNDGSESTPWQTLEYAVSTINSKYKILSDTSIVLLTDLSIVSDVKIDFSELSGLGSINIFGNNQTIFFLADLNIVNSSFSNGLSFSNINFVFSPSRGSKKIEIENTNKCFFSDCTFKKISLTFTKCYYSVVSQSEFENSFLTFKYCIDPSFSVVSLRNNSSILFDNCFGNARSLVLALMEDFNSGSPAITYKHCSGIEFTGDLYFDCPLIKAGLFEFVYCQNLFINVLFVNRSGDIVERTGSFDLISLKSSFINYSSSLVPNFIETGKTFSIDNESKIVWDSISSSPLELPVFDRINSVDQEANLNGNNFRSTAGLTSSNISEAIDELKSQLNSIQSINVETITADKQLQNTDARTQDLTNPSTTQIQILLPTSPSLGKEFVFMNSELSSGNLLINGSVIAPSDRYAIIWNGNQWREL